MAGLKKKKKEKSGSPNIVLVVFLVLFVICSITLGVMLYYAIDEKSEWQRKFKQVTEKGLDAEKSHSAYLEYLQSEYRLALGDTLKEEEMARVNLDREVFNDDNGKMKAEVSRAAAKTLIDKMRKDLGVDAGKDYPPGGYSAALAAATKKFEENEGNAKKEADKLAATKAELKALSEAQIDLYKDALARIAKGEKAIMAKIIEQSDAFKAIQENNQKLNQELVDSGKALNELKGEYETKINIMTKAINVLKAENKENADLAKAGGPATTLTRGDTFPLLLDISPGKPLWDYPVGKITRVDLDLRQVTINLGEVHGARPELTFNIFGVNPQGRAEKSMKGSIEIIKVLDKNSSLCRITSLYDSEQIEIPLGAETQGRILRETDAPLRAGDLLFNLFWGTRVAVAGYVDITGERSDNPADQIRQMEDFIALCKRNGMQVDAYVDLRDGSIQGNISAKTRYLIRGWAVGEAGAMKRPAPKVADADKDGDKDKDPAPKAPPAPVNAERNEAVNKSSAQLFNDARALGLLMISAENFANVVGYRKARNANLPEISSFRPQLPYAGSVDAGVLRERAPMPEEKKAPPEMKKDE